MSLRLSHQAPQFIEPLTLCSFADGAMLVRRVYARRRGGAVGHFWEMTPGGREAYNIKIIQICKVKSRISRRIIMNVGSERLILFAYLSAQSTLPAGHLIFI